MTVHVETLKGWLENFLAAHGAIAGTIHRREADTLHLVAAINIPPPVIEKTRTIPKGKGMAGLAWERDRTVATCNLKEDATGDVRPGAKAVDARGAVAIPVRGADGQLRAVVGIAFMEDRNFSEAELDALERAAEALPDEAVR